MSTYDVTVQFVKDVPLGALAIGVASVVIYIVLYMLLAPAASGFAAQTASRKSTLGFATDRGAAGVQYVTTETSPMAGIKGQVGFAPRDKLGFKEVPASALWPMSNKDAATYALEVLPAGLESNAPAVDSGAAALYGRMTKSGFSGGYRKLSDDALAVVSQGKA